jgi:hypothetical protein
MSNARARLLARCATLGAELEDDGGMLTIDAPSGMRFVGTQTHTLRVSYDHPRGAWRKAEAYAAMLDDLALGVERCEGTDCEDCQFTDRESRSTYE